MLFAETDIHLQQMPFKGKILFKGNVYSELLGDSFNSLNSQLCQ